MPRRPFYRCFHHLLLYLGTALVIVGGLVAYRAFYMEPNMLETRYVDGTLPFSHKGQPIKVVIAGDFHLRPGDSERLARIMTAIMSQRPDMICLMGDYAYGHSPDSSMSPAEAAPYFAGLKAPMGVFCLQGNHDVYYGWQAWAEMMSKCGLMPLLNSTRLLTLPDGRQLQLSTIRDDYDKRVRAEEIPQRISQKLPHILLTHVADVAPLLVPGQVDLAIAGHTHGGQVCLPWGQPLSDISRMDIDITYPYATLYNTTFLVTRGLGCSILPVRLFCPPEIIVLTIQ